MQKTAEHGKSHFSSWPNNRCITTSLYDVLTAVNEEVSLRERELVPLIVKDILSKGRAHIARGMTRAGGAQGL